LSSIGWGDPPDCVKRGGEQVQRQMISELARRGSLCPALRPRFFGLAWIQFYQNTKSMRPLREGKDRVPWVCGAEKGEHLPCVFKGIRKTSPKRENQYRGTTVDEFSPFFTNKRG